MLDEYEGVHGLRLPYQGCRTLRCTRSVRAGTISRIDAAHAHLGAVRAAPHVAIGRRPPSGRFRRPPASSRRIRRASALSSFGLGPCVRRPKLRGASKTRPSERSTIKATASDQHLSDVTCFQVGATLPEEVPAVRFSRSFAVSTSPQSGPILAKRDPFGFLERDSFRVSCGRTPQFRAAARQTVSPRKRPW